MKLTRDFPECKSDFLLSVAPVKGLWQKTIQEIPGAYNYKRLGVTWVALRAGYLLMNTNIFS